MEIIRDQNHTGEFAVVRWSARDGRTCEVRVSTSGDIHVTSGTDKVALQYVGTDGIRVITESTEIHLNETDGR